MNFFYRNHTSRQGQGGFSLIEVLVGLVLSGLLMSMVAMVLGQSITNNEVVRSSAGLSSRMFTLRRILHRDMQNIWKGGNIDPLKTGFSFPTSHSELLSGGVQVIAEWDFSSNMIRREESSPGLEYGSSSLFLRGLESWQIEFLDAKNGAWVSLQQLLARSIGDSQTLTAVRIKLRFEDGQDIMIVERVPYALQ